MGNNNYYSNNNEDRKCNNNVCDHMNFENFFNRSNESKECNHHENNHNHDKECTNHHERECNNHHERECCGRRFNNRSVDRDVKRALEAFEEQLENTEDAIDCLNRVFNNLEDEIFEDRCCPSNRIKNILRSIQKEICDLQDDLQDIEDDFECLEQAL